jgi:hypothetical protein
MPAPDGDANEARSEDQGIDITEKISETLEPALAGFAERVSEAIVESLSQSSDSQDAADDDESDDVEESAAAERESDSEDNATAARDEDSNHRSLLGGLATKGLSSIADSFEDNGSETLESFVDSIIDSLFSRRTRGVAYRFADNGLQKVLYDILDDIDDEEERNELYNEALRELRPEVREVVDVVFSRRMRRALSRQAKDALPLLLRGQTDEAWSTFSKAFDGLFDDVEDAVRESAAENTQLIYKITSALVKDEITDQFDEKVDREAIQERVQSKVEEARDKLQEAVGNLQHGARGVQSKVHDRVGGRRAEEHHKQGMPPSGGPPQGFPPSGRPPSGKPPSGRPPHGRPPEGIHPAVQRRMDSQQSRGRR